MQKYTLNKLAKIESGKSFRKKPDEDLNGNCLLLQMKDVSIDGINQNPLRVMIEEVNPNHLLQDGDVLFVAKGNNNYATAFRSSQSTVAISVFFVIRPNISVIYPEYLAWYINSKEAQIQFEKGRMGATVGNIRKGVLEKLKVPVPSIEAQISIESINRLWRQEKNMTLKLLEKKEIYYNNLLTDIYSNMNTSKNPEDTKVWYDIWTHSIYYPAHVELKTPITLDGETTSEVVCIFHQLETESKEFKYADGRTLSTPQVSGWHYILMKDLKEWNNPELSVAAKKKKVLRFLNHGLIKKIELRDREGRIVLSKMTN
jgi:hypothetical protein